MLNKSTALHLRFPFSFFLLPVFLFALSQSIHPDLLRSCLVFFIFHFLVYPASNGYNSYFDKDESSIGGLKAPPPVSKQLYTTSLALDVIALILSLFLLSWQFAIGVFIYGLASKAYSHPSIRLKKYSVIGWLTIGIFQGAVTFITCYIGINNIVLSQVIETNQWIPAILGSILLLGSYPMTQIYQHQEDLKRGDITLSHRLGIQGTFYFTAIFFGVASLCFYIFYFETRSMFVANIFILFMIPTVTFFFYWFLQVRENVKNANFQNTMRLNFISSLSLNLFFLISLLLTM